MKLPRGNINIAGIYDVYKQMDGCFIVRISVTACSLDISNVSQSREIVFLLMKGIYTNSSKAYSNFIDIQSSQSIYILFSILGIRTRQCITNVIMLGELFCCTLQRRNSNRPSRGKNVTNSHRVQNQIIRASCTLGGRKESGNSNVVTKQRDSHNLLLDSTGLQLITYLVLAEAVESKRSPRLQPSTVSLDYFQRTFLFEI